MKYLIINGRKYDLVEDYKNGLGKEAIETIVAAFCKHPIKMYPNAVEQTILIACREHPYC